MTTISIKSDSPETVITLITSALDREKRIIMDSLKSAHEKVNALAKTLGVDVEKLMRGEIDHSEADDMKLIELEGEVELIKHFESELKELDSLEICG